MGATDAEVQLLSGHRRWDTLLRYLGWGYESNEAARATASRASKVSREAAATGVHVAATMKMGRWWDFNGDQRRPVKAAPSLFPRQALLSNDPRLEDVYGGTKNGPSTPIPFLPSTCLLCSPLSSLRVAFEGPIRLLRSTE